MPGGSHLKTVGWETGYGDVLDAVQTASDELARADSVPDVAETALAQALHLTASSVAFLVVAEEGGRGRRVFSRSSDPLRPPAQDELDRMLSTVGSDQAAAPVTTACTRPLVAGGRPLGMLGVAGPSVFTVVQRQSFAILAHHVAGAIAFAEAAERRKEMVDTLVNLRADLDRSEHQRVVSEERARGAERLEHAHEAAVDALLAVSRHAQSGQGLAEFHRRLTRSIAELVGAEKVLFWEVDEQGSLNPIRGSSGVDEDFMASLQPAPCAPDRDDLASRVVFQDLMFRASRTDESHDFDNVLDHLGVDSALAVPWRAGDRRLGLVGAYDSRRAGGFSREDGWVLQKAALAAGLVWQLRSAESDLKKTVERLQKVDAARQMLLKNVSTAVDKARKRFAGDLHDDALQKLTAAELQLERLHDPNGDTAALLADAQALLGETEDALRRLLFEVRPPALEIPGGLCATIRERVRMLKSVTEAEVELELDLPDELPTDYRSMLFRQLTEALANVEKHAAAKHVSILLKSEEGGVRGVIKDDGRGFVVAERDRLPGHLGLLALNERAVLAGGWNKITSEPGLGTTVEFWVPLGGTRV